MSRTKKRALIYEPLEPRSMLASLVEGSPWHNPLLPNDINLDGTVSPADALIAINALNNGMSGELAGTLAIPTLEESDVVYLDANGDGAFTPLDLMRVFNALNGDGAPDAGVELPPIQEQQDEVIELTLANGFARARAEFNTEADMDMFRVVAAASGLNVALFSLTERRATISIVNTNQETLGTASTPDVPGHRPTIVEVPTEIGSTYFVVVAGGAAVTGDYWLQVANHEAKVVDVPPPAAEPAPSSTSGHGGDSAKHEEHEALLRLVPDAQATHRAVASGSWSDAFTWGGSVPGSNARVVIPHGITVTVDQLRTERLHWLRVDGKLRFATDRVTQVAVDTLIVAPDGVLEVGTTTARVDPRYSARILIADRGPIDTTWDPLLLSRGLIAHGAVTMAGAAKTGSVALAKDPLKGDVQVVLSRQPANWRLGDRVVFAGTSDSQNEDDDRVIAALSADGMTVTLNRPLDFNHPTLVGHAPLAVNFTRNVVIESENKVDVGQRGHVMMMHNASKVMIDNAGFYHLGRTLAEAVATDPALDAEGHLIPATAANPRGRYSLHIHRGGTDKTMPPARVTGSAITDGKKLGLVSHSSYVIAEGNATFNIDGSHFFTEVGNEVGEFRGNIAIRSRNGQLFQEAIGARFMASDFGFTGNGIWLQGGGVDVVGNILSGHTTAVAAFFIPLPEISREPFRAANLRTGAPPGTTTISAAVAPVLIKDTLAFGLHNGVVIKYTGCCVVPIGAPHLIDGATLVNVSASGINLTYANSVTVRDVYLHNGVSHIRGDAFTGNGAGNGFVFEDVSAEGFATGLNLTTFFGQDPFGLTVNGAELNNRVNVYIPPHNNTNRRATLNNLRFGNLPTGSLKASGPYDSTPGLQAGEQVDFYMGNIYFNSAYRPIDSIPALFNPLDPFTRIDVRSSTNIVTAWGDTITVDGKYLLFDEQDRKFNMNQLKMLPDEWKYKADGSAMTAGDLWDRHQIGLGGVVPANGVASGRIKYGYFSDTPVRYLSPVITSSATDDLVNSPTYTVRTKEGYDNFLNKRDNPVVVHQTVTLTPGLNLVPVTLDGITHSHVVFLDQQAPVKFEPWGNAHTQISYADLAKRGFELTIAGYLTDQLSSNFTSKYYYYATARDLTVDADGKIRFTFPVLDKAGNALAMPLVTTVLNYVPSGDTTAPVISNVAASAAYGRGRISWTTDEASMTQVEYWAEGKPASFTAIDTELVTSHQVDIFLASNTTYNFRVKSKDQFGNAATLGVFTIIT